MIRVVAVITAKPGRRAELLEVSVVVLIMLEIVLMLLRR